MKTANLMMGRPLIVWMVVIACHSVSGMEAARTWTSVSGATIEARYVGMERGEIVLQGADGTQFRIQPGLLSEADQNYVRQRLEGEPAPPAATDPGETARPAQVDSRNIPGLNLAQPDEARMIGLQTGPGADQVVYFIADRSSGSEFMDTMYMYTPSASGPQQVRKLSSRSRRLDRDPYVEFETLRFSARHGQVQADHEVTFHGGARRWDLIWLEVKSRYTAGRESQDIEAYGTVNNELQVGHGVIPVIPLAMPFRIHLRQNPSRPHQIQTGLFYGGEMFIRGPRRLLESVRMEALDPAENVAESPRIQTSESQDFPEARPRNMVGEFTRLTGGIQYQIVAKVDLGPLFGETETRINITVP